MNEHYLELKKLIDVNKGYDIERIDRAYALAEKAHEGQLRATGEPYIIHPIAVACIIAKEMKMGANPVIAAFLHDVVEDTDYTVEDIEENKTIKEKVE